MHWPWNWLLTLTLNWPEDLLCPLTWPLVLIMTLKPVVDIDLEINKLTMKLIFASTLLVTKAEIFIISFLFFVIRFFWFILMLLLLTDRLFWRVRMTGNQTSTLVGKGLLDVIQNLSNSVQSYQKSKSILHLLKATFSYLTNVPFQQIKLQTYCILYISYCKQYFYLADNFFPVSQVPRKENISFAALTVV